MSHPTWVRGLKQRCGDELGESCESHPTWVRGLKRGGHSDASLRLCRTLRGCVD